jgi:hypothetical protein
MGFLKNNLIKLMFATTSLTGVFGCNGPVRYSPEVIPVFNKGAITDSIPGVLKLENNDLHNNDSHNVKMYTDSLGNSFITHPDDKMIVIDLQGNSRIVDGKFNAEKSNDPAENLGQATFTRLRCPSKDGGPNFLITFKNAQKITFSTVQCK